MFYSYYMKFIYSLIIFTVCIQQSFAQYVVFNIQLGNCIRCYKNLSELSKCMTSYPAFIALDPALATDSTEIFKTFKVDQFGYDVTFDSTLYHRTKHADFSSFNFFNENDSLILQQDILKTKTSICDELDFHVNLTLQDACFNKYNADKQFRFNILTGITEVLVQDQKIKSIYSSIVTADDVYQLLSDEKKKINTPTTLQELYSNPLIVNKIKYANVWDIGNLSFLYEYLIIQEISDGDTIVEKRYAIIEYDLSTGEKSLRSIEMPDKGLLGFGFLIANDSSIVLLTENTLENIRELVKKPEPIYNVSEFVLREGIYTFKQYFPIDLAPIFREKFLYNNFSLHASNYPYLSIYKDHYIYNLNTGASWNILENNLEVKSVTKNFSTPYLDKNLEVIGIIRGKDNGTFHVLFQLDSKHYVYTAGANRASNTVLIEHVLSKFLSENKHKINLADCDDANKRIYLRLTNNKTIVFPSALWED